MKLMKHITIALVLCAIPAMAFAQTAACGDCNHEVSVYHGTGGLIATAEEDAEMVAYRATCDNVTRIGTLEADDDGVVSMLFRDELACMAKGGGTFEIGPVEDGGWFWIEAGSNSAVGNLVAKDVLKNEMVELTDAGDSVTEVEGKGANLLMHNESGRVGILPTILPEPPADPLRRCGYNDRGTVGTSATATADAANARFTRRLSDCAQGDGGTITLATTTNTFSGATTRVADKATVVRPSGTGAAVITIDLWGNEGGHFTTASTGHALLGQPAVAMTPLRGAARLTGVTYTARLGAGPTAAPLVPSVATAGITMNTNTENVVTFNIEADSAYCSTTPPRNNPASVSVSAVITEEGAAAVTPSISRHAATGVAGGTSFTVVCGSAAASANMGQELVPENPFPTRK